MSEIREGRKKEEYLHSSRRLIFTSTNDPQSLFDGENFRLGKWLIIHPDYREIFTYLNPVMLARRRKA